VTGPLPLALMDDLVPPFADRLSARQWTSLDIAIAAVLAALSALEVVNGHTLAPTGAGWYVARYVSVAVSCAALPLRRRSPMAVLGATAVGLGLLCALSGEIVAEFIVAPVAYSVASAASPRASLRAVVPAAVAIEAGALTSDAVGHGTAALVVLACSLIGWLAGENTRARRSYLEARLERAAEREREQEQQARRAGAEERLRIARELHDVVAHAMSIIAVRSGVARMVLDSRPDEARETLGIIEGTSRQALQELRLLVGVLRGDDSDGPEAGREPAPGLADLEALVSRVSEAGVMVGLHVEGTPRPLGPGTDLSAYRIVQEALTNVVRHAAPASAELTLRYRSSELVIEVSNDGRARPRPPSSAGVQPGAGHGIAGMRERVAVYGGKLVAEPTASGFRVVAHIPIEEAAP
jgi:signal transduction histidine kinase